MTEPGQPLLVLAQRMIDLRLLKCRSLERLCERFAKGAVTDQRALPVVPAHPIGVETSILELEIELSEKLVEGVLVSLLVRLHDRRQIVRRPVKDAERHSIETEVAVELLAFAVPCHGLKK